MERSLAAAAAAAVVAAAVADLLDELLCTDQVGGGVDPLISQGSARKDGHARRLAPAVRQEAMPRTRSSVRFASTLSLMAQCGGLHARKSGARTKVGASLTCTRTCGLAKPIGMPRIFVVGRAVGAGLVAAEARHAQAQTSLWPREGASNGHLPVNEATKNTSRQSRSHQYVVCIFSSRQIGHTGCFSPAVAHSRGKPRAGRTNIRRATGRQHYTLFSQ